MQSEIVGFTVEIDNFQVETVQDVSGLPLGKDAVEVRQGARHSGEITITRGMDKSTVFTDWINTTLVHADVDAARQNIAVVMKDSAKNTVRRFTLINARASQWEGPSPAVGDDSPAVERVTIAFKDISVE
ncbi:phage tail protein [Streptomyces sp. ET3-23]|uniref:phage tail protein n=1 Tax=Streptomyces sp. ET3-23 TaxID=2885643 RepID=UPI001D12779E|nr:phage tail protein [Streptomyces sp. ET3-23]MCC2275753.1 phage tail protein [Streptomyces sp. ET3-23]